MKVTAKATRSGDWWAIEVPEVPGAFTQAKRLDQVPDMVRDAVALLEDVAPESIDVIVLPQLGDDTYAELVEARNKREVAAMLEREASESIAGLAQRLSASGLTLRDIGVVLGVSYQRVGQLVDQPPASTVDLSARRSASATRSATPGRFSASRSGRRKTARTN